MAAGYAFAFGRCGVNRFFSSVIRIQNDRGQPSSRPDLTPLIRHPGYTAGIVIIVASGIALGSWLAARAGRAHSLPFLLHRAITEDRVLKTELPGYRDYAERVRWRLVPGIW